MHPRVRPDPAVPLAPLCTLGVGGPAQYVASAASEADTLEAVRWARDQGLPLRVLGGGSNLVISDAGVEGLILRVALRGITRREEAGEVVFSVGAGEVWDDFVAVAVAENCQGLECLAGIPGLVGATPIQNVGAYGQEVSESIEAVRVLDRRDLTVLELTAQDCAFGYRDSLFKSARPDRYVVLRVSFRLKRNGPPKIAYGELARHLGVENHAEAPSRRPSLQQVREAIVELRRRKSMVIDPTDPNRRSCGSFFVNALLSPADVARIEQVADETPPAFPQADGRCKVPSAWLIERAGLGRGTRIGPVGLSSRHTLALVAHDGATAQDVVAFAHHVRATVKARFGVQLVPEPDFWGFGATEDRLPLQR
jgi:UDP-N-acetylmuramate dehydrogenase